LQRRELFAPPIEMLLRFCPQRRYLLLVISVTGVISVGVDKLEPVLHQAKEFVERFHQRVMLLFACLTVGVSATFLLDFLMAGSIFACCSSIRMRSGSAHTLPIPHTSAAAMIIIVVFVFVFMAE
jgi:hypothetical protein